MTSKTKVGLQSFYFRMGILSFIFLTSSALCVQQAFAAHGQQQQAILRPDLRSAWSTLEENVELDEFHRVWPEFVQHFTDLFFDLHTEGNPPEPIFNQKYFNINPVTLVTPLLYQLDKMNVPQYVFPFSPKLPGNDTLLKAVQETFKRELEKMVLRRQGSLSRPPTKQSNKALEKNARESMKSLLSFIDFDNLRDDLRELAETDGGFLRLLKFLDTPQLRSAYYELKKNEKFLEAVKILRLDEGPSFDLYYDLPVLFEELIGWTNGNDLGDLDENIDIENLLRQHQQLSSLSSLSSGSSFKEEKSSASGFSNRFLTNNWQQLKQMNNNYRLQKAKAQILHRLDTLDPKSIRNGSEILLRSFGHLFLEPNESSETSKTMTLIDDQTLVSIIKKYVTDFDEHQALPLVLNFMKKTDQVDLLNTFYNSIKSKVDLGKLVGHFGQLYKELHLDSVSNSLTDLLLKLNTEVLMERLDELVQNVDLFRMQRIATDADIAKIKGVEPDFSPEDLKQLEFVLIWGVKMIDELLTVGHREVDDLGKLLWIVLDQFDTDRVSSLVVEMWEEVNPQRFQGEWNQLIQGLEVEEGTLFLGGLFEDYWRDLVNQWAAVLDQLGLSFSTTAKWEKLFSQKFKDALLDLSATLRTTFDKALEDFIRELEEEDAGGKNEL